MYARRFYRKTPPGYSGVLFAPTKEAAARESTGGVGIISEEDGALFREQRRAHRNDVGKRALIGKEWIGYLLSPLFRKEEIAVESFSDGLEKELSCKMALDKTEAEEKELKKRELYDELTLIGILLLLLGAGLDSESVLVLLAALTMIT